MLESLFGAETPLAVRFFIAFIVVFALIGVVAWLVRRFGTGALGAQGSRGRAPRLAVIEAGAVDGRRKLVLIRRDNVEHLIMIGGPTDIVGRLAAERLSRSWNVQVIADNRPGSGGNIGTEQCARAPADGYTMCMISIAQSISPAIYRKLGFDPVRDFAHVTLLATLPSLLVVHPSLPVKSVQELIAFARGRPGVLNYASGGSGTSSHLLMEMFNQQAGIQTMHIIYKGTGPALVDQLSGRIEVAFTRQPHQVAAGGEHLLDRSAIGRIDGRCRVGRAGVAAVRDHHDARHAAPYVSLAHAAQSAGQVAAPGVRLEGRIAGWRQRLAERPDLGLETRAERRTQPPHGFARRVDAGTIRHVVETHAARHVD